MVLEVVQTIWEGVQGLVSSFLTTDNIFFVGIGFTLLMVLFFFIKSALSYECKLERSVNRLNEWLFKHQTITENNLIEFNNLIKDSKSPKILRKHWQQYMLYRDKLPSEYMSAYNCIDKPAKTSSFTANIKNFIAIYRVAAVVTLFLSIITFSAKESMTLTYLSLAMVAPVAIILIGLIFTLILRTMQNYNLASLYQTFHIFNRYIDKASATIPKYVDFEILFTKKEIKNGIPILGEYLEKRARQEQEELEEAQRNAVSHEEYDFSASGVDGSLVLERAMKESETYLNFKQRTLSEIQQFESEISTLKKNYENTSKDYQRKLQASKENMERLRQQQEESTNRIEVNYIRKQQQDEVKKQEQLEKDQEDATNKFNTEINSLSGEIEKRRADIEDRRQKVQSAMESEYQTFSSKLHKAIATDVEKASDEIVQKISNEKEQYAQAIQFLKNEVDNKDAIITAKDQTIEELQIRLASLENTAEEVDEPAFEEYQPQEYEEETNGVNENVESTEEFVSDEQVEEYEQNEEDLLEESVEEYEQDQQADEDVTDIDARIDEYSEGDEVEEFEQEMETADLESSDEVEAENVEEEQADGHYDDRGYYWFNDKTYYDADGYYHDLEGNVLDAEGNLYATDQEVEVENIDTAEDVEEEQNIPETENMDSSKDLDVVENDQVQDDDIDDQILAALVDKEPDVQADENIEGKTEQEELGQETDENMSDPATETLETEPKRGRGRPKKEAQKEPSDKPKRGRGRPKKTETIETGKAEKSAPKRRGRPKKEALQKEVSTDEPKRGRGRPKKAEQQVVSDEPKRGRGRPKKINETAGEATPKRSVGRPKKEKSEAATPKRRAGRPKKSENSENKAAMDILKQLGQSLVEASEKQSKTGSKKSKK